MRRKYQPGGVSENFLRLLSGCNSSVLSFCTSPSLQHMTLSEREIVNRHNRQLKSIMTYQLCTSMPNDIPRPRLSCHFISRDFLLDRAVLNDSVIKRDSRNKVSRSYLP